MQYVVKTFQKRIDYVKNYRVCFLEIEDNIDLESIRNIKSKHIARVLWLSKPCTHRGTTTKSIFFNYLSLATDVCERYGRISAVGGETGEKALQSYGRHLPQTRERVLELSERGFLFFAGNNPHMVNAEKWSLCELIRVAQVNSKTHGYSIKTLWAVRPNSPIFTKEKRTEKERFYQGSTELDLLDLDTALSMYNNPSEQTKRRAIALAENGYQFIVNKNQRMDGAKKWQRYDPIRVAVKNWGLCLWAIPPQTYIDLESL